MFTIPSVLTQTNFYQIFIDPLVSRFKFLLTEKSFGRRSISHKIPDVLEGYKIEENWCLDDKNNLIHYVTVYDPKVKDHIDVVRVHGMADYGARFLSFSLPYLEQGFRLHLMDLPGHGHSDGVHCFFDVKSCVKALSEVIIHSKHKYQIDKQIYLSGQSLGGMVILCYCLKIENQSEQKLIRGFNLHCPCIKLYDRAEPHRIIRTFLTFLNNFVPRLPLIKPLKNVCSSDPLVEENFTKDPLTYTKYLRLGSSISLVKQSRLFPDKFESINTPFLIQQGRNDRVVDPYGAQMLYEAANTKDKSIVFYNDCEHEMYSDKCSDQIFKDSVNWMLKRSKR